MTVREFATYRELAAYVTAEGLTNPLIVQILERDGRWFIFHA